MGGARWFSAVTGSLSGVWARIVACLQAQQGLGSLEEYQREVGRLRGELSIKQLSAVSNQLSANAP